MNEATVELICDAKAELGEGPIWDYRRGLLCWVDINGRAIHLYDPVANRDRTLDVGQEVGCVALRNDGGLIFAGRRGFWGIDIESGEIAPLLDPEPHMTGNRFNDGKCDPRGRFWAGTMSTEGLPGRGSLYCLYPDFTLRTFVTGVTTSNGLAWSADQKTLYYIDTPTQEIAAFDYDPETGALSSRRTAVRVPPERGKPDGMAIDTDGMLWVALYGGGAITRWDPRDGRLVAAFDVPAPRVTSCCFAGVRMDEMYITTARSGLDPKDLEAFPLSGGLFRLKPGAHGCHEPLFGG